jgi:hypothetical protein
VLLSSLLYYSWLLQTPPRVITLDEHYFPAADDFPNHAEQLEENVSAAVTEPKPQYHTEQRLVVR